ncbi:MAG: hypothetical protein GWN97_04560, partial [Thermoplasmata archaeon]|nr:hypothetical protein [Thermoplasmata archaeon]
MSRGKFTSKLEEELKDPDNEEHMLFFDVNEDGRSLRVRFSESSYEGRKFLEATKIDFKPRDEMDEDKVMSKVVVLEDALIVLAYDELRRVFLQEDEDEG